MFWPSLNKAVSTSICLWSFGPKRTWLPSPATGNQASPVQMHIASPKPVPAPMTAIFLRLAVGSHRRDPHLRRDAVRQRPEGKSLKIRTGIPTVSSKMHRKSSNQNSSSACAGRQQVQRCPWTQQHSPGALRPSVQPVNRNTYIGIEEGL